MSELQAAIEAQLGGRVSLPSTLQGGRSGVTLQAEWSRPDGETVGIVIKAAPPGRKPVGRHDVLRQSRVIRAVASVEGVVVPQILAEGTEPVHFYVMSRSSGQAVEPVLDAAEISLPAELVTARARAAAQMLAALHQCDEIPAPPGVAQEPIAGLADELARWQATADAADPQILVGGQRLFELLRHHSPSEEFEAVLVHGDFRLGNLVFDGPTPTGLIDWEIWGRTHPGIDLGWLLVFCDASLFPGIGAPVQGMPDSTELLALYHRAGGRRFEQLAWFEAFGRFKMAAIMAHNLRRHREGRHLDPFQEKLPPTIARLVETGIEKLSV